MVRGRSAVSQWRFDQALRSVLIGDIIAAARAILAVPATEQTRFLQDVLDQAHAAHMFHKRKMRPHPTWGNGSLMSRVNTEPQVSEPFASDLLYLEALQKVIGALISRNTQAAAR